MNRDDIIRMARNEYDIYAFTAESLAEFATLVAAAEREACAKVAESYEPRCDVCPKGVAAAIRARGES